MFRPSLGDKPPVLSASRFPSGRLAGPCRILLKRRMPCLLLLDGPAWACYLDSGLEVGLVSDCVGSGFGVMLSGLRHRGGMSKLLGIATTITWGLASSA